MGLLFKRSHKYNVTFNLFSHNFFFTLFFFNYFLYSELTLEGKEVRKTFWITKKLIFMLLWMFLKNDNNNAMNTYPYRLIVERGFFLRQKLRSYGNCRQPQTQIAVKVIILCQKQDNLSHRGKIVLSFYQRSLPRSFYIHIWRITDRRLGTHISDIGSNSLINKSLNPITAQVRV